MVGHDMVKRKFRLAIVLTVTISLQITAIKTGSAETVSIEMPQAFQDQIHTSVSVCKTQKCFIDYMEAAATASANNYEVAFKEQVLPVKQSATVLKDTCLSDITSRRGRQPDLKDEFGCYLRALDQIKSRVGHILAQRSHAPPGVPIPIPTPTDGPTGQGHYQENYQELIEKDSTIAEVFHSKSLCVGAEYDDCYAKNLAILGKQISAAIASLLGAYKGLTRVQVAGKDCEKKNFDCSKPLSVNGSWIDNITARGENVDFDPKIKFVYFPAASPGRKATRSEKKILPPEAAGGPLQEGGNIKAGGAL